ncbi:MAG: alpha-glucosidase/alpha-galactosidase [Clostridia bacterium]|nr:alpha-glucosidase/alpha-galactosidase [Clostridia bacterium]
MKSIKIAYIGGGSRGWAWGLMSDLVQAEDICGKVALYDIDKKAAKDNVIIGNKFNQVEGAKTHWDYEATDTLDEALTGADFVVISILPGTFDEMESDVHTPEKYGIWQSVGDTAGPGGIVRALRTMPMMEVIAKGVERCCPNAWVINYTNPMTLSVKALYDAFPAIKAFGCCHEVFGTQRLMAIALKTELNMEKPARDAIKVNVVGVNHFTWLTKAQYQDIDLMPVYSDLAEKYAEKGYTEGMDKNWMNNSFLCSQKVKFDLFRRFGVIAAAGDRHLAEFCPGKWYLESPEKVKEWGFGLTTVDWRKNNLKNRLACSARRVSGEEQLELAPTGEDGVNQIRALLGLHEMVTNVNIPNRGQIPNLPLGAVVETNAVFRDNSLEPVFAGPIPTQIHSLINNIVGEQEMLAKAVRERDLEQAFQTFTVDNLVTISHTDARKLFDEMINNTKHYLADYFK